MLTPFTDNDFAAAQRAHRQYYCDRRLTYYRAAIDVARQLSPDAETALEFGPYRLPLYREADTLDHRDDLKPTYCRDGGDLPWPIADKSYDLFVALQSFEHLGNLDGVHSRRSLQGDYGVVQAAAFREVERIAHSAVISLPWHWHCPNDKRHHGINDDTLQNWFHLPPQLTEICENRIILGWQFE